MKIVAAIALACATLSAASAQTFDSSKDPVFQKVVRLNKGLASYTAHIEVATRLPLARFTLRGTLYSRGDRSKIVFDNVPAIAKPLLEGQPSIPASSLQKRYAISVVSRSAEATTYHLVPREPESVRSIDVVVQNSSGLVQRYVWVNKNGMKITSNQAYESIGGYQLVSTTSTQTRGAIHADSETTFSDYRLNVSVPDSVFAPTR